MKKIAYLITGLNIGGAEKVLYGLVSGIDKDKYEVIVISLLNTGSIGKEIEKLGIKVYGLGFKFPFHIIKSIPKLLKIVKCFRPHLIHAFMIHAAFLSCFLKTINFKTKIIWNIFSVDLSSKKNGLLTLILIKICSYLSKVIPTKMIFDSKSALNSHLKVGYDSSIMNVINNGIDTNIFKSDKDLKKKYKDKNNLKGAKIVGLIGRFHPMKGHSIFFKSCKKVIDNKAKVKILINGPGINERNKELKSMIKEHGLKKHIHISDENLRITEILPVCDIIVLSSISESFPNILCEAMSSLIPCVSTDTGGCKEIISNAGIIVPNGDTVSLANGILKLLNMNVKDFNQLAEKARLRIKDNYTKEIMINSYMNVYKSIIN